MSTEASGVPGPPGPSAEPLAGTADTASAAAATRPFYWSVRRELWENRSLYLTPLAVAGVVLLSVLVRTLSLVARLRTAGALDAAEQQGKLGGPFSMAASVIIMFTYLAAALYCLDALYGERRDRSILFWKSLPVSDLTTVLAKLSVPVLVLPPIIFAVVIATQLAMLVWGTVVAGLTGLDPTMLVRRVPLVPMSFVMAYGLAVHALWHAPLYAWLLLVSGWAKRMPLLWAVLPPLAVGVFERMAFGTGYVGRLVRYRLMGTLSVAFDFKASGSLVPVLEPLRFLTSFGLWSGLAVAALFVLLAVRVRRYREPI
jgi:ABC-2 type transport system permease protein